MGNRFWSSLCKGVFGSEVAAYEPVGAGHWPSHFRTTDLAEASIGLAGAALARLQGGPVRVDRRRAALWFDMTLRPQGWEMPSLWDPVAGNYPCKDGWIRLHTNAPHHLERALAVLGAPAERGAVARAVLDWTGVDLENAIVAAGGCAAEMRSMQDWARHPQGRAVASEPLVHWKSHGVRPPGAGDLRGVKVLDLTRVLAGPVATRFLAGFGADVLRIDPPDWNEPGVEMEVTPGKRCAGLDLRQPEDMARLKELMAEADVLVHGYRAGALERLGLGDDVRRALNPDLVDVRLNAYGWSGPWSGRRGFDSLVQMSCGIAAHGMAEAGADKPVPLPVQALDHAAGYLMAACVLEGLARRAQGEVVSARVSLARVAHELMQYPCAFETAGAITLSDCDFGAGVEQTSRGAALRVAPPLTVGGRVPSWRIAAGHVRRHEPVWNSANMYNGGRKL